MTVTSTLVPLEGGPFNGEIRTFYVLHPYFSVMGGRYYLETGPVYVFVPKGQKHVGNSGRDRPVAV